MGEPTLGLTPDDYAKVINCLKLTTSDKDGEILAAVKGVNGILDRYKKSWDTVFDELGRHAIEMARLEVQNREPTVEEALAKVLKTSSGTFHEMIVSYQRQWAERHSLSELQRDTLFKAYYRSDPRLRRRR